MERAMVILVILANSTVIYVMKGVKVVGHGFFAKVFDRIRGYAQDLGYLFQDLVFQAFTLFPGKRFAG